MTSSGLEKHLYIQYICIYTQVLTFKILYMLVKYLYSYKKSNVLSLGIL